ncbi:fimbrial biogenesis chaperone [Vibrio furnissii]|uniref:fimbrial biogenesis chaperone n=1 Tax=Vibrio furnissii TaxID=29494 RepID=UPI001EEB736B|nr:molecular chaperone [Vibrio furnissii]MCG6216889.1 molecular chaperone [Vibrio furnissii]
MHKLKFLFAFSSLTLWQGLLFALPAHAGVTAETSRVVFNSSKKEQSLQLANLNAYPVIVQTWIDDGSPQSTPSDAQSPLITIPPVFHLAPGEEKPLRIINVNQAPQAVHDREQLFWLNIYEVPPSEKEMAFHLQLTMRTQMKVFYRPPGLKSKLASLIDEQAFSLQRQHMTIDNRSPFFVTYSQFVFERGLVLPGVMVSPFSQADVLLPPAHGLTAGDNLTFSYIDDWGDVNEATASLK